MAKINGRGNIGGWNSFGNWNAGIPFSEPQNAAPEPTSSYSLDFANATYTGPSGTIANPFASIITLTRAQAILVPNASGAYQSFGVNTPAITNAGWFIRAESRTNKIRNNSMTGAATGTPGTIPTRWSLTAPPAGMTVDVVATGSSDPVKGLPYVDFRIQGTSASNSNIEIQPGNNGDCAAVENDRHVISAWLAIVGGTFPIDNTSAIRLKMVHVGSSNQSTGAAGTVTGLDKVFARDTTPRRLKLNGMATTGNATTIALVQPRITIAIKASTAYDYTLRIIAPQLELVSDAQSDASLPILTTTAAVTHAPDAVTVTGAMLTMIQGAQAGIELNTSQLVGSGIDYRKTYPMVVANGSVNLLYRTDKGELASDLGSTVKTYRSWRTQFGWRQDHRVQWGAGKLQVATTSAAHKSIGSASIPAISSVALKVDGAIMKMVVDDGFKANLSAYVNQAADLVVYGATSGGIVAAASAIQDGKTAVVVGGWREAVPGGMAAGGLGAVDASVSVLSDAFGGMALDYTRWCNEYSATGNPDTKAIQSLHAQLYFDYMINKYQINTRWSKGVVGVTKTGAKLTSFSTMQGQVFTGSEFIDCGYEGDLMAAAGVTFRVGREAADANNAFNGNLGILAYTSLSSGVSDHQFTPGTGDGYTAILTVDPFVTVNTPASGLLEGVQSSVVGTTGAADNAIQAYNFRVTATRAANRVSFYPSGAPSGYYAARYELLGRYLSALTSAGKTAVAFGGNPTASQYDIGLFMIVNGIGTLYDLNSNNGFSTDTMGSNWGTGWANIMTAAGVSSPSANYAVGSYAEREIFWKWQESHTRGLFYWLGESGDSRIPTIIRDDARLFGLEPTHYLDPHENDSANWMPQLYVREARAVVGQLILENADVSATDGTTPRSTNVIGQGSYAVDSHHVRRMAVQVSSVWKTVNEGNLFAVQGGNKRFPIAMEYIMPQAAECTNLLVTFAASARHTGFGALRMELAHMGMSEAAALMATQRIADNTSSTGVVSYSPVRTKMLARGLVVDQTN